MKKVILYLIILVTFSAVVMVIYEENQIERIYILDK